MSVSNAEDMDTINSNLVAAMVPICTSMTVIGLLSGAQYLRRRRRQRGEVTDSDSAGGSNSRGHSDRHTEGPPKRRRRRPTKNKFKPRVSELDTGGSMLSGWKQPEVESTLDTSDLRGFYSLFVILVFYYSVTSMFSSYQSTGRLLADGGAHLWVLLRELPWLVIELAGVYFWSFSAFFLQKAITAGYVTGIWVHILHHGIQTVLIFSAVALTLLPSADPWPMSQRVAMLAQTVCLFMKMHSYIMTNRHLAARAEARAVRVTATPGGKVDKASLRALDALSDAALRVKLRRAGKATNGTHDDLVARVVDSVTPSDSTPRPGRSRTGSDVGTATDSGDEDSGPRPFPGATVVRVQYPANVTLWNYCMFTLYPTLCYEPYYPRTKKFRVTYFLEKAVMCVSLMNCCTVVMSSSLLPVFARINNMTPWAALSELLVPILFMWILTFFIIFECMLNAVAELTFFADRRFYSDWWNSTTFDEFARKWNAPVHEFLLRHVYLESMDEHNLSKPAATFVTFIFSMLLHELILATAFEMVQGWLFLFSLLQLPLIPLMRSPVFKGKRLGNLVFWWGTITGIPLVTVLYAKQYCQVHDCGDVATFQ